uniref:Uncharacterized protein n=1 Tax=Megaviridae environmental sample TaxID=1737588 RepID=A0A5J6VJ10_9VIRU|nr:MAG: hypothetical protein [Megaviridae environmental sample]
MHIYTDIPILFWVCYVLLTNQDKHMIGNVILNAFIHWIGIGVCYVYFQNKILTANNTTDITTTMNSMFYYLLIASIIQYINNIILTIVFFCITVYFAMTNYHLQTIAPSINLHQIGTSITAAAA